MILILLFMLVLGPAQVIWAIVAAITARRRGIRQHMRYYLLGVLVYFAVLLMGQEGLDEWLEGTWMGVHFFFNAFLLASYHLGILIYYMRFPTDDEVNAEVERNWQEAME